MICRAHKVELPEACTVGKLMDRLASHFLEPRCLQPTFLCHHPLAVSPLAKQLPHKQAGVVSAARFELFIAGKEICNAYTELNDPREQRLRFLQQAQARAEGDLEAQPLDNDFCEVLEYGLPPTAGWGIGIDRLCMLLSRSSHIREVQLFTVMKPEQDPLMETDLNKLRKLSP
jgi:lysyl-tRNA synthetase class 2